MTHRLLKWLVAGATLAVLAAFAAGGAFAGSAPAKSDVRPEFTTVGGVAPQFLPNATASCRTTRTRPAPPRIRSAGSPTFTL